MTDEPAAIILGPQGQTPQDAHNPSDIDIQGAFCEAGVAADANPYGVRLQSLLR